VIAMNAETEQKYLDEISEINADYWANNDPNHEFVKNRLINKFGSREKAIEATFIFIWNGFVKALEEVYLNI
jgi:hypothetical protein